MVKMKSFKAYILAAAVVLIVAAGILFACFTGKNKKVVAAVNDIPIYQEEIIFAASELRLSIRNEWMNTYNLDSEGFSWGKSYDGGESALACVTDRAVRIIAGDKLLQKIALDKGLMEAIDYPSIQKQMESENAQRQEKKSKNEVFYGITSFPESQYYDYLNQNLRLQVIRKLSEDELLVLSDEEMQEIYNENMEYFQNEDFESVKMSVKDLGLKEKFDQYMEDMLAKADIQINKPEVMEQAVKKAVM